MINVIGAGPVGAFAAQSLSEKGFDVNLYEEDKAIGKPVQCTGLLTKDFLKYFKNYELDDFVVNKIKNIRIVSGESFTIPVNEYIVDRTLFDSYLVKRAQNNGVNLFSHHKFISKDDEYIYFENGVKQKYDFVIGSDGPRSSVAKQFEMGGKREFWMGMQAKVKLESNPDEYVVYFDQEKYPGFFAWQVPEDETYSRVGVAGIRPKKAFEELLKELGVKDIVEYQCGLIPMYDRSIVSQKDNAYLIGDAALQVKATTGGGIVPGMNAVKYLTDSIENNSNYDVNWKRKLGLNLHLKIRNVLDKFSNSDYERLVNLMSTEKVVKVMGETSRDDVVKLAFKMAIAQPRLISFLPKLFK